MSTLNFVGLLFVSYFAGPHLLGLLFSIVEVILWPFMWGERRRERDAQARLSMLMSQRTLSPEEYGDLVALKIKYRMVVTQ